MSSTSSSEHSNRGVARILNKLENAILTNNWYEAHQLYRTIYFRYLSQKKYENCLELLYRGALTFFKKEQHISGSDLCILLIDTLEKVKDNVDNEIWLHRVGSLIGKIGPNIIEREAIIIKAIKWSSDIAKNNLGHPTLHKMLAQTFWSERNIESARHHYLLSGDGASCGHMLVKLSQEKGYDSETDLFIAQVVLQQLCLKEIGTALQTFNTYTKYHPKIGSTEPPFLMPLLNFIYFLLKTIENGRLNAFKPLCELYNVSIKRDPSYEKYLQKIGTIFFGIMPTQQEGGIGMGAMSGIFGIFNRLFQGLDQDDDDTTDGASNRNVNSNLRSETSNSS